MFKMDRLFDLRKSLLNQSTSSELGYETALDDSSVSLYYSVMDDTLDMDAESLNNSNHSQDANESFDGENQFVSNLQSTTATVSSIGSLLPMSSLTDSVTSVALSGNSLESIGSIVGVLVAIPVAVPVSVTSVESNAYSSPSSAQISENKNCVLPTSNSDSNPISTFTSVDNQMDVSTRQESKSTILTKSRIQFGFSNDMIKQRSSSVPVLQSASTSQIVSSSTAMRSHNPMAIQGSKSQRTLERFQSISEIPQSSTLTAKQRGVLSSYNTSQSIIPKSILTKSSSVQELKREPVSMDIDDSGISSVRPNERESAAKKSPPHESIDVRAGPSGLVKREFIAPKVNHICSICKKAFPLRSTLILHKMEHKDENLLTCRYCDRSFKFPLAIANHFKDNCEKIPPAVRKRLLTEDFNKTNI